MNVFDVVDVIDVENGRFDLLLDWLAENPDGGDDMALLQFNHPASGKKSAKDYGRKNFGGGDELARSEEHTSELQSLMRISYAVLCLKKKKLTHASITYP